MSAQDIYQQLASAYGYSHSGTMGMIFQAMLDEREVQALLQLPGTPQEIAARLNREVGEVRLILQNAFNVGLVFRRPAGEGVLRYALISNLIDAVLGDKRVNARGKGFLDLWKKFTRETNAAAGGGNYGPPSRVVPVEDVLETQSRILPYESVCAIIRNARKRIVVECACRKRTGNCDAPLEMCLMLDNAAEYMLSRGAGRTLSVQEAMVILDNAEDLGLVHETGRNAHGIEFLCNCCACCCCFLRAHLRFGNHDKSIRSRYRPAWNADLCTQCGECAKRCHFGALTLKDDAPVFDLDKCVGCGLCASRCAPRAITLVSAEPPEFIPQKPNKALFGSKGEDTLLIT